MWLFPRCLILLLLLAPASAEYVEETLGPYQISFDLTNNSVNVLNTPPTETSGVSFYWLYLMSEKNNKSVASIEIVHSGAGIVYDHHSIGAELPDNWTAESYTSRQIDGHEGSFVKGISPKKKILYVCVYNLNKFTLVTVKSAMPLNKGTGDLLSTLHVAY